MTRINGQRVSAEIRGVCVGQYIRPTDEVHGGAQEMEGEYFTISLSFLHISHFSRIAVSLSTPRRRRCRRASCCRHRVRRLLETGSRHSHYDSIING